MRKWKKGDVHRDVIWTCFTMVARPHADRNKRFLDIVLVVRRNISSTTADGKLAEYPAMMRVKSDMEQLEMHSSSTEKAGYGPRRASECGMHDEKREKWRVSSRVWRSAGMQSA